MARKLTFDYPPHWPVATNQHGTGYQKAPRCDIVTVRSIYLHEERVLVKRMTQSLSWSLEDMRTPDEEVTLGWIQMRTRQGEQVTAYLLPEYDESSC